MIRQFLLEELIQKPREHFEEIFSDMAEQGLIKPISPKLLAIEYQAFYIYKFYEKSILLEEIFDFETELNEKGKHVDFFWGFIKK